MAESRSGPDQVVAQMFAQRFPSVTLESFNALRKISGIWAHDHHIITFIGSGDELLRLGLIEKFMLPTWPKRNRYWRDVSNQVDPAVGDWHSKWRKRDCLHVWRELTDALPKDHALAPFGVKAWPFGETASARQARFQAEIARVLAEIFGYTRGCLRTVAEEFAIDEDLYLKAAPALARFGDELLTALQDLAAHRRSGFRPRLVVDNTRNGVAIG